MLERAAVVGRQFSRAAVAQLLPRGDARRPRHPARIAAAQRAVEPDAGWFLGEPALRFHHVLIRDAAYRRLLKGTRAELHGRFAEWVESRVGESIEHDETIGWHLEQAHQHLRELGPIDAQGRALGERAARYLAAAGRRALARDDLPLAASLLGRALERLDSGGSRACRPGSRLVRSAARRRRRRPRRAARSTSSAASSDDLGAPARAGTPASPASCAALTDPQALRATADAVAAAAEELASAGDAAGEAKAHSVHALALARLGKVGACEAALDRALAAARRAGDRRRSNAVLAGAPLAALWGPSPVTRASGRCLDVVRVLRITQGAPAVEAVALRCQGVLEALRGRGEAARRMIASSRRMVEELGITHRLLEADMFAGLIELLEGDAAAAERSLRAAYDGLAGPGARRSTRRRPPRFSAARCSPRAGLPRPKRSATRARRSPATTCRRRSPGGRARRSAGAARRARGRRRASPVPPSTSPPRPTRCSSTPMPASRSPRHCAPPAASDEAAAEEARAIELWEAKGATLLAERARRGGGARRAGGSSARGSRRAGAAGAPPGASERRDRERGSLRAAFAARDADAIADLIADDSRPCTTPPASTYDRQGVARHASRRCSELESRRIAHEPLGDPRRLARAVPPCRCRRAASPAASSTSAPTSARRSS